MTSITAATLLAFLAGALLLQVICVNVSASAPCDWTPSGRIVSWIFSAVFGVIFSATVYASLVEIAAAPSAGSQEQGE